MATITKAEKCWRCRGDGYFFRVPDGFNPFCAGAMMTAQVSEKIHCYECGGTGRAALKQKEGE